MSTSRGSGGGANGAPQIPAGSRKVVQSLKEIVSCSEAEIYATLKDCNMDPNEAVNRLLSQDTFHEVKRKKEKKKEGKDNTESRARGASNISNRSSKSGGPDRYSGRGGSTAYYSSESAPLHAKPAYRRENGSTAYTSSLSSAAAMSGTNRGGGPPVLSEENKGSVLGSRDVMLPVPQPPSANHSAWVGAPGQVSMADIVKMGRPHNKVGNTMNASHNKVQGPTTSQHVPVIDEWPSIEKPATSKDFFAHDYTVSSEVHPEALAVAFESVNQDYEEEEDEETEDDDDIENPGTNDIENPGTNDEAVIVDSRGESSFENDLYNSTGCYQPQAHDFEEVGASVASVTRNLQQLSVEKDEDESPSDEIVPSVVIPDHLQVQTADCSHLTFGSFGSVMNVVHSSVSMPYVPVKTNLEEADISSIGHQDSRNSEYYVDDSLRNVSDGTLFPGTGSSSSLQQEELKPENAEVSHGDQYSFPLSNPGYSYDNNNAQNLDAAFSHTNSEMQNLAQFSTVMQSYPNSLPSTLLAANVHANRESELHQYSQFSASQQMPGKYGNPVSSSIGGSTISMSEALKTAGLQPAPLTQSGANVASGPPLPQHLSVHPYSQPTLPLAPFANMIGYPFLPQSYTYMPSAFQQAFAGNSNYHQSLAAVLPQYKSSVSMSSLPQSAASIAAGFGGAFGNNTATIHGNFSMNQPAAVAPSGPALSYDDVLSSQYKDHLISLQQQENSAMRMHGHNSRTMPSIPASTYYNNYHQTQTQQQPAGGFRQAQQQPSQNYVELGGYPNNYYHSQAGMSLDQQTQNPRDGSLGGPQGQQQQQQPKQSQLWQNTY